MAALIQPIASGVNASMRATLFDRILRKVNSITLRASGFPMAGCKEKPRPVMPSGAVGCGRLVPGGQFHDLATDHRLQAFLVERDHVLRLVGASGKARSATCEPRVPAQASCSGRSCLVDHLVGAGEQRLWHDQAERLRRFEIDHQLELGRPLDRQIGRVDVVGVV
jgi:hypothetical protein